MKNSERLGRQARLGIEAGTFRLPILSAEPLRHWKMKCEMNYRMFIILPMYFNQ